jgi:tRNA-splicing ligase RtcB
MESSFGSSCHGAGRQLSRTAARKRVDPNELIKELKERGISIKAGSNRGISEEAPEAYKNVSSVVDTVQKAGIARKVAKLKPVVVIKG